MPVLCGRTATQHGTTQQEGGRTAGVDLGCEEVKEADIPQWCAQLEGV